MSFKKLFISLALVVGFASMSQAAMKSYNLTITTNTPTGSATLFTNGGYPNITGGAWLAGIIISSGVYAGGQTVTFYDTCTASTTATAKWQIYMPTSSSTTFTYSWPPVRYKVTNPCIAADGAGSHLKATFFYE